MTDCPDVDLLVTLSALSRGGSQAVLDHLSACESCRTDLADLDAARMLLTEEVTAPAGFADRVMAGLSGEGTASREAQPARGVGLAALLIPALAAASALLALALGAAAGATLAAWPVGLTCLGTAGVAAWWSHARLRAPSPPFASRAGR